MSSSEDKLFLAELIEVTQISENLFTGNCLPGATGRVFGGQVAAQAMRSATLIRPASRDIHSYSCIFLRPGKPEFEVRYIVSELRNGKSLTTYRVDAYQDIDGDESLIMTSTSSFHIKEESQSYQDQMPSVIPAEECGLAGYIPPGSKSRVREPIDFRWPYGPPNSIVSSQPRQLTWFKSKDLLPDDPMVHACALTYITDLTLTRTAHMPLNNPQSRQLGASLDHSMHFHRPFRADEWILFEQEAASYSGSRSIASGKIFTKDGLLAVSVRQEALIRRTTEV
jgi:acyl-CoA thioesterase-2